MKGIYLFLIFFLGLSCEQLEKETIVWQLNDTHAVGGNSVTISGNPKVIGSGGNKFVEFDGRNDGMLVNGNPISGMDEFSIEVVFKPYPGYPENREQRFLHIQDPENENRRILIELRLNGQGEWYGDWFIKSEDESLALIDSTQVHSINEWATISLTYKNGQIKGFVNGKEEVSGEFEYLPIDKKARTSIGTRMDQRSWFKGAIKEIRFAPEILIE